LVASICVDFYKLFVSFYLCVGL